MKLSEWLRCLSMIPPECVLSADQIDREKRVEKAMKRTEHVLHELEREAQIVSRKPVPSAANDP